MERYRITQDEIACNNVKSAPTNNFGNDPVENKNIFDKLPELIAGRFNGFISEVIAKFTEYYTKEETDSAINSKITEIGAGDMAKAVYDANEDGVVDRASVADNAQQLCGHGAEYFAAVENGIFVYTHTAGALNGSGSNGRFKATVSETVSALYVNGTSCAVKCGEETEMELVEGCWYSFILDGTDVNFKAGGAGLNFKIVGGTTQPTSPKENTIWVNTSTAIKEYQFSATQPTTRADGTALQSGDIWIKTGLTSDAEMQIMKKNGIKLYPIFAHQYNGSAWVSAVAKSYINGAWKTWFAGVLFDGGNGRDVRFERNFNMSQAQANNGSVSITSAIILSTIGGQGAIVTTEQKVSLKEYKTLKVTHSSGATNFHICVHTAIGNVFRDITKAGVTASDTSTETTLDISSITDECYISLGVNNGGSSTTQKVQLVR